MTSSAGPRGRRTAPPPGLPAQAFDAAPFTVAATWDADHRLAYANPRHRGLFGDAPLGTPFARACPDLAGDEFLSRMDTVQRTGEPYVFTALPVVLHVPGEGSTEKLFTCSLSPAVAPDGLRGVLVVSTEVTGQIEAQRRILHRFQRLVGASEQKTLVADPAGRALELSGWEHVTGRTRAELIGDGWLDTAHPEDRPALEKAWRDAVRDVPERFEHVYRLRYRDGSYRHCRIGAVPLRDDGTLVEWVAGCSDIEEEWLEERRAALLARAAAVVGDAASAEESFAALSHVVVPALADQCGIYLLPDWPGEGSKAETLTVQRVAATARRGLEARLPPLRDEHVDPHVHSAFTHAALARVPARATFPPGQAPPGFAPPALAPWIVKAQAHSGVLVPVLVDGTVAAVVSAFVCGAREAISDQDTELIRDILEHAHGPLRNALELHRTRRVANALQHSLLTAPPHVPGLQISARYRASATTAEVGGDWYDSFLLPDGVASLVIGDVAGHDLAAAVTMSRMRNMLRGLAVDRTEPPGDIVRRLDLAAQCLGPEETTATCVFCRVEPMGDGHWRLNYAVAGHPPPLVVEADGSSRFLEASHGPLLGGISPEIPRGNALERLGPDCTLLLYTDGLVERPGEDIDTSLERLRERAETLVTAPLEDFCDELVDRHNPGTSDDIALIALRTEPDPHGA
ncbi:SpoIIE family protein phosphatase [Streptomyces sp. DSM 42041]|uniref:SpoIIE family protein phosphatase n=1 Tax=Streptomyces hazeniae TaxID=3075538 RepID=A0ABU2NQL9_9ACTN|nr:SpoIIE family protein phosphatase [Streptomyces sp. DSM 42041]MDT0378518.1 SpoIIE family protein phosphatase [Streptomyces sp. DSM 42041]